MITSIPNMGMDRNQEYIVAAAYKLKPEYCIVGHIYKDETVRTPDDVIDDIFTIEIGRSHADILKRHGSRVQQDQDGFYTNFGRFVDRYEAYKIASRNHQVDPGLTCDSPFNASGLKPRLFSEDVFWSYPTKYTSNKCKHRFDDINEFDFTC